MSRLTIVLDMKETYHNPRSLKETNKHLIWSISRVETEFLKCSARSAAGSLVSIRPIVRANFKTKVLRASRTVNVFLDEISCNLGLVSTKQQIQFYSTILPI